MGFCARINCGYYWQATGEAYARCHFDGPDGWAPCEVEDEEEEVEDRYTLADLGNNWW